MRRGDGSDDFDNSPPPVEEEVVMRRVAHSDVASALHRLNFDAVLMRTGSPKAGRAHPSTVRVGPVGPARGRTGYDGHSTPDYVLRIAFLVSLLVDR